MKYYNIDDGNYPIITVKTFPVDPSVEDINEMFSLLEKTIESHQGPYVCVSYNVGTKFISSEARIQMGKHVARLATKFKNRDLGTILVVQGNVAQLILKAIALVYAPLKDYTITKDLQEGMRIAQQRLAEVSKI